MQMKTHIKMRNILKISREIEFNTISFEESLRKLEESIIELNEFDQLDLETNQNVSDLINFKMRLLYEKKKYLTQLLLITKIEAKF